MSATNKNQRPIPKGRALRCGVPQRGFMLVELMIALTILSVLAGLAVAYFGPYIARQQSLATANMLYSHLALARNQSVFSRHSVIACASENSQDCLGSDDWSRGWIVFSDLNKNRHRDLNESLLRVAGPWSNAGTTIKLIAGANNGRFIRYGSTGTAWPNGRFQLCSQGHQASRLELIVYRAGRSRIARPTSTLAPSCTSV